MQLLRGKRVKVARNLEARQTMTDALRGMRILELAAGPAAGLATMILADFGAEVMRIRHPDGNLDDTLPAATMYRRGKASLSLDLDKAPDRERFESLCANADVLVCSWRSAALARRGLDFEVLQARHPHLSLAHISGFGSSGPLAEVPGYEHAVAAYAGRMQTFAGIVDRPGPVFSALQVAVHACAQATAAGILASQYARGERGKGQLVETSLLQGLLAYEQGAMIGHQFAEHLGSLLPAMQIPPEPPPPSLYYHPAQAGDGRWMQFGNLLPHLFDNFLIATDLIDVIADEGFDPKQLLLRPEAKQEAFRERMLKRIQERSASAWMETFVADGGIVAAPYQTTQEALEDPDIVANGHVIARGTGRRELGPLARLTATPAKPGADADAAALEQSWQASGPQTTATRANAGLPLAGVRVVELATIIAAPMGASLLADMGAEVIKVEQIGGDPFRSMLNGIGASRVNPGKDSISVNLKSPEGQAAVQKLLASADVVIHNYRPGVPEKLGIDYDRVSADNPGVVYLQCNGYGPDGPGALRPSTHPIPGAAMGGVMYQMGEQLPEALQDFASLRLWTSRLMRANEVNPDPNTAMVIASTAMLGLSARQRTGQGQQILVDMFGANAYANHDDFFSYPGKPRRALPDTDLLGLHPTYRLYTCADGQWVFFAAPSHRERAAFSETLAAAGIEPPGEALLTANDEQTAEALAQLFATRDADSWQALLSSAGVACVRADADPPSTFWLESAQVAANGFIADAEHPRWGAYQRHGPMAKFGGMTQTLHGPPLAGQHNSKVLESLGYTAAEIEQMTTDGILWRETS